MPTTRLVHRDEIEDVPERVWPAGEHYAYAASIAREMEERYTVQKAMAAWPDVREEVFSVSAIGGEIDAVLRRGEAQLSR